MSLLVFQHDEREDAACLGATLQAHGHSLVHVKLYAEEPVPADLDGVDGIISMGGPMNVDMNVDQADEYSWMNDEMAMLKSAHEAGLPIVGICLGAQLLAKALGGEVAAMETPEVGWHEVKLAFPGTTDTLMNGIHWETTQFHLHGQEVTQLPAGAAPLSGSKACRTQAFRVGFKTYGFQYHFEWDQKQLAMFAEDDIVQKAGASSSAIKSEIKEYYDQYRRLGDRLADNIATYLFALSKRRVG